MSKNHNKIIAAHCEAMMPQRIKDLVELATADLLYGPPYPGDYADRAEELNLENPEQYRNYDFSTCCREIGDWADDELPSRLWLDSQSDCVAESDPTRGEYAEACAREGCPILEEDYFLYDSQDIREAAVGILAEYL